MTNTTTTAPLIPCTQTGCDRIGDKGFKTDKGRAQHERMAHSNLTTITTPTQSQEDTMTDTTTTVTAEFDAETEALLNGFDEELSQAGILSEEDEAPAKVEAPEAYFTEDIGGIAMIGFLVPEVVKTEAPAPVPTKNIQRMTVKVTVDLDLGAYVAKHGIQGAGTAWSPARAHLVNLIKEVLEGSEEDLAKFVESIKTA